MVPSSSAHWVTGQHDVGQRGGLATARSRDDQQVERRQPLARRGAAFGRGDHDVAAEDQQRPRPVRRAERVEQLVRRAAPARAASSGSTPQTAGDVRAGRRVVDHPVAGQLVGLLPVLAAALAVALAGEAAVAGAGAPGQAERERQVDPGRARCRCPGLCCSAPRAVSTIARLGAGRAASASARSSAAGTPVTRSTRSGHQAADRRGVRRRSRSCARRRTPRRPRPSAIEQVQQPEREGEVGAGHRLRGTGRPGRRSRCAAGRSRRPGRRARAAGRGAGPPAAWSRRGWSRPAPARRSARRRRAGTAARGRCRTPGCRPTPPRTCSTGRCSRSGWCRSATRANLPSW